MVAATGHIDGAHHRRIRSAFVDPLLVLAGFRAM
jgi:hypothetical protein